VHKVATDLESKALQDVEVVAVAGCSTLDLVVDHLLPCDARRCVLCSNSHSACFSL